MLIGANTVILPGTNLPEGIACGANLVLKKSIEYKEWTIISEGRILPRRGKEKILSEIKKFYK